MKTTVDSDACIGCGICVSMCPNVYHMNDDYKSEASADNIDTSDENDAREACDSCPVNAIEII